MLRIQRTVDRVVKMYTLSGYRFGGSRPSVSWAVAVAVVYYGIPTVILVDTGCSCLLTQIEQSDPIAV